MPNLERWKNRLIAKLITRFPRLAAPLLAAHLPQETAGQIPWTPITKPLGNCRVAVVTTSGVHHRRQRPFNMLDQEGDPSLRVLDGATIFDDFTISHDYYDHTDAEKDLNIVLPLQRLRELAQEGIIGSVANDHFSFMGHIVGPHLETLKERTAPQLAALLRAAEVDLVLLTPA
ncbi:glycine/sarcosine/betaine reductase selenoprotein B family protein [Desulfuromonas carbonis]|uniref:glycine/sarcosine/betaine reductase selenoprotein B family protein n=1 Tax=Desulfuromonas sp. DDH964 TaxID=1823759 RepID=UPI0008371C58|nr:glycine/sarcosine/betaine reductase selenoprotein B family protein [Desulfuromonas sp. DDH964]